MDIAVSERLRFTTTHEWVLAVNEKTIVVGITTERQECLSDIVRIEFPDPGDQLEAGDAAGILEGVNDTTDFLAPVAGTVTEVNERLVTSPELVNLDPYGDGWLFKMKPKRMGALEDLIEEHEFDHVMDDDEK